MLTKKLSPFLLTVVVAVVSCGPAAAPIAPPSSPPPSTPSPKASSSQERVLPVAAPKKPVVHTYFGTNVSDDYEWLEDGTSAEAKAFTEAQNALTRSKLDALPNRSALHERVTTIYSARAADWFGVRYEAGKLFALKDVPPKQQHILVTMTKEGDPASEKIILDPNALDTAGKTTIDWFVPSPDGKLVAVSLSKDGTESGDVHVIDVATGKDRNSDTITRVNGGTAGGSLAWNVDGTGFHYTRYPRSGERPPADLDFFQQVWFHKLGTAESADVYAIGKEFPRIAEVELERSDDGKRVLARVSNGDGGEVEHHVFSAAVEGAGGKWTRLSHFEDEMAAAAFGPDGKVYVVSRKGSPRGKVVAFAPPYDQPATEVLPEGDAVVEDVVITKGGALYVIEVADGPSRVRRFPLASKSEPLAREQPKKAAPAPTKKGAPSVASSVTPPPTIAVGARGPAAAILPLPPVSSITGVTRVGDDLLLRMESYVEPPKWMLYKSAEHRLVATGLTKKAAYDMSDVEVVRETCTSKDGTKVPMSILRKKGVGSAAGPKLDGSMPAYLTGYGGFGVTIKPRMRATYRLWLDHGGVVAETNLRGGGERGEVWHRAGNLTKKQNVFDDFAACAKTLFDLGYTRPEKLAISGRSNGGLLMGAEITQHPEMFRVVAAAVGIYDMLRTELSPNGAFNVTEYGSVKDEAQFKALHAYSPFHNVKDGTAYPSILFMSGANDPRVDPYHSRKFIARLQSATSSPRPILLRASADTGHGMGTPLAAEIEEVTDMLSFLLFEVGAR